MIGLVIEACVHAELPLNQGLVHGCSQSDNGSRVQSAMIYKTWVHAKWPQSQDLGMYMCDMTAALGLGAPVSL